MLLLSVLGMESTASAQAFVHPGGLHTQADLDRMKAQVAAGAHPWIDDWNLLITDPQAQNTYTAEAQADMGANRQRADADAHAAYLNAIRWYISGNTTYADCAVRICNAWSTQVNTVPSNTGLVGIPIFDFAMAAEVLRTYSGWAPADFARFQNMMETYLYPSCNSFLTTHNGAAIDAYWANWDACNIGGLIAMGVLCDDRAKFNQGVTYFETGAGNGSIIHAVYVLYNPTLGQWQESGRDQEHAQLGIGLLGSACQVAWNQGVDLFGYDNNRLLAGAEYVAQTNLSKPVPYTYYTNSAQANQTWVSQNGLGRLDDRPVWELIYNHYAVLEGLSAPNSQAMAQLMRPEHGSSDHFGYGTLTFTLNAAASPYPPLPVPAAPTGLTATASVSQVALNWNSSPTNAAQGYNVLRSTTSGGPYTSITSWTANTNPQYVDTTVTNGVTYYYVVQAINQSGTSVNSLQAHATPVATGALPAGWTNQDIGTASVSGSAAYSGVGNGTFIANGTGSGIGGSSDTGYNYTYESVTGNFTLTTRLWNVNWNGQSGIVGLMMRETLNPNSAALLMTLGDTGNREAKFGIRASTGANLNWYNGDDYSIVPAWFRLQRSGNTFTAFDSSDGVNWFTVGTSTQTMASTYYAGLVICNGTSSLNTTTFDNVTPAVPVAPTDLIATPGANQISLSWVGSFGAMAYNVKRSAVSGGPYTTLATGVTGTSYIDTTANAATNDYYVVTAINGVGESAPSVEAESSTTQVTETGFVPSGDDIVLGQGGILSIDESTGTYTSSVVRATGLAIDGGAGYTTGISSNEPANFLVNGSPSGNTSDFFGPLDLLSGAFFGKITPNAASHQLITFDSLSRNPGTELNFAHSTNFGLGVGTDSIASATADSANVVFTTPPSVLMSGGSGTAGTSTLSILPFAFVNNCLATYDTTYGLRPLNSTTEMATLASGMTVGQNAKVTGNTTLSANTSVNALWGTGGTISGTGTLTVTSGAVVCNVSFTLANAGLAFGSAEGLINVANSRTLTVNSVITGTGGLTIGLEDYNGTTASLVMGGSNTYTGLTIIEGSNAALKVVLTNGLALQDSTLDYNNYGASLQFGTGSTNVTAATFGGLNGAQNLALTNSGTSGGAVALSVGSDGDSTTYAGVLSGAGSLTKTGAGTLTLTGTNAYTGTTAVNGGSLIVDGSIASGSAVTVNTGGTLGGLGTINGAAVAASGGILAPGSGETGTLTFSGGLNLKGGSILDLGLGSSSGLIALSAGTYTAPTNGVVTVNVSALSGFGAGTYPLIKGASGISASSFVMGVAPSGYAYTFSASSGTLSLVVATAPAAPTNLTAAASGSSIDLNWTGSTSATSYKIARGTTTGGPYTAAGNSTTAAFTDSTVTGGMTYYYVVTAQNAAGVSSSSSNEASATVLTGYQQWLIANNLAVTTSQDSMPDNDGLPLLLKYATGLTPGTTSVAGPAAISSSGNFLTLVFDRLSPAPVNYLVESSPDLVNWSPLATLNAGTSSWTGPASVTESGTNPVQVTLTDSVAMPTGTSTGTATPRFLRLRVTTSTDTTEPGTIPQGEVPMSLAGSTTSATSLPLDNTPVDRNSVQAVATSALTVVNASAWSSGSTPFALRLLSGNGSGATFAVSAVSGNTVNLTTQGVDLTQLVAVGDLYEILPLDTLGSFYGTAASILQSGGSAASADNVLLWNGTTWLTYFNNGTNWMRSGSLLSQNNQALPLGGGHMIVRRGATPVYFNLIGRVPEVALQQFTTPGGNTFLSSAYPLATTLGATGFASNANWLTGGSASSADNVLIWNGVTWLTYFNNGTNWLRSGSFLNQNTFALPIGQPLMILRRGSPTANNSLITQPLIYTP